MPIEHMKKIKAAQKVRLSLWDQHGVILQPLKHH